MSRRDGKTARHRGPEVEGRAKEGIRERIREIMRACADGGPKKLAEKAGVSERTVRIWLEADVKRLRIPSGTSLLALCRATGYSADWILFGEGPELRGAEVSERVTAEAFNSFVVLHIREHYPPELHIKKHMLRRGLLGLAVERSAKEEIGRLLGANAPAETRTPSAPAEPPTALRDPDPLTEEEFAARQAQDDASIDVFCKRERLTRAEWLERFAAPSPPVDPYPLMAPPPIGAPGADLSGKSGPVGRACSPPPCASVYPSGAGPAD